ncbi:MAG TPA: hypothetical protein VGN81_08145 [Pseudonocardiaceae bacterium]
MPRNTATATTTTRFSLVAAPLCLFGYGMVRLFGMRAGGYGPGTAWLAAHALGVLAFLLFVPIVLAFGGELRRSSPRGWVPAAVVVALAGLAALVVQFGVDFVAGLSRDHAGLVAVEHSFGALPGAELTFYQVGPQLFYVAFAALLILLAVARKLAWWAPVVALVGLALPILTLNLLPIGALCLFAGLLPMVIRTSSDAGSPRRLGV